MLLTLDIGNTNITAGIFDGDNLKFVTRLDTNRARMRDQYAAELLQIFKLHETAPMSFKAVVISSVVPELTDIISDAVNMLTGLNPLLVSPGIKTGLNILTENPAEVGADLVAVSVGALNEYKLPCIIIDLGTASKIMALDKNGAFLGCAICPGVAVSLEALSARTSQLPNISFCAPAHAIGKNTVESMRSGTVFGTAAMIDGLCDRIEKELGSPAETIVATGGYSEGIIPCCSHKIIHDKTLILKGLKAIYNKNTK